MYEKNAEAVIPNASTTKILTAIVAYENADMSDIVTVSKNAASVGGSTINLRSGDKVLLGNLMKGMLLSSGNDAAVAIAEHVGGSVESFCNMMNERAKELGASNTHFLTPHGLDMEGHCTTAKDLGIFANYLLNIPYLAEIVNMRSTSIKINDYTKEIRSTNEMLGIYGEANGIKTGYTSKAGRCLVTSITRNDRQIIVIVLGCNTKKQRTSESIQLVNYAYNEFEEIDIYKEMKKSFSVNIEKSLNKVYEIVLSGSNYAILPKKAERKLEYEYEIEKNMIAPVKKGEKVGKITIKDGIQIMEEVEIYMPVAIERKTMLDYFIELMDKQKTHVQLKI